MPWIHLQPIIKNRSCLKIQFLRTDFLKAADWRTKVDTENKTSSRRMTLDRVLKSDAYFSKFRNVITEISPLHHQVEVNLSKDHSICFSKLPIGKQKTNKVSNLHQESRTMLEILESSAYLSKFLDVATEISRLGEA